MTDRLPLMVISGYLGAGKTTLINRLLAEDHGLRLLVMVNDFGAINIDAELLESETDDTLTLSNGCVCCTMGADLFMAIGDVLDRPNRPDHLIIEASGIADPARIAQVAHAERDLSYGGIITVVDMAQYASLAADPQIGAQVAQQVKVADIVGLSKTDGMQTTPEFDFGLADDGQVIDLARLETLAPALFGFSTRGVPQVHTALHRHYTAWHHESDEELSRDALMRRLEARPKAAFRIKGFVGCDRNRSWEVQCVGSSIDVKEREGPHATQLVGIGLADRITEAEIAAWWLG